MKYRLSNNFVLRTPFFSLEKRNLVLQDGNSGKESIKKICQSKYIKEAFYLASPSFYLEFEKWLNGKIPNRKEEEKVIQSVRRYLLRMCTRCTPFGLFSGISLGNIENDSIIEMQSMYNNNIQLRLDMDYVCALANDLSNNPSIRKHLRYYPNNSIYQIGNKLHYVEYFFQESTRKYHITEIDTTTYLHIILKNAKSGKTLSELAFTIVDDEITYEDALDFVNDMANSQILVSELEPTVTGADSFNCMIKTLDKYAENHNIQTITFHLKQIYDALETMKQEKIGHSLSEYKMIKDNLAVFPTHFNEQHLFQADLIKHTKKCNFSKKLSNEILQVVDLLMKLQSAENSNLKKFKESYYERYEDAEMPLAQVIDSESGIGYLQNTYHGITPLIDNILFPIKRTSFESIIYTPYDEMLKNKLYTALQKHSKIIELQDDDFIGINTNLDNTPSTLSVFVQLLNNNSYFIKSFGGSCAANLLGRFCYMDKELYKHVKTIINADEIDKDNKIYAEIVHLPEARVGNVLQRPHLREYEIPYLTLSSLPIEKQIPIDDLYVSIKGNHIHLRSKRLNKEVIPRLTTAHNFSYKSLPIYHFLCDMQMQGIKSSYGFSWGVFHNKMPYLPRVIYKNAILALQTWCFYGKDILILNQKKSNKEKILFLKEIMKERSVSNEVVLEDGDNELYINIQNEMSLEMLVNLVKKRSFFILKEFLFSDNESIVKCGQTTFSNEIILSYYKN